MKILEERIKQDGKVLPGGILKVNNFLNHQIDPQLMLDCGKEFAELFKHEQIDRILTIEASGIAPAIMAGLVMKVPVVFAKKKKPSTTGEAYTADVYSYTKNVTNTISVEKQFIQPNEHILIIDDFMANGEAAKGMVQICKEAGATVSGIGIAITKSFQKGEQALIDAGYRVESLARIASFDDDQVHLVGE
ncbi:MAG: xanthine phosphoribosyltransferase [Lactobacillus sp.]|nr:xanthine phosphoribosyltransferase [Lactobacillus sp.]